MATSFATRMDRLGTETAFEVLARARALEAQGRDVIHLEVGEPDFDTPANIVAAGTEALQSGWTHYGPAPGDPELRAAIANYINTTRNHQYKPEQVVVTPGGKPVMFFTMLALLEKGDEAIYPDPGFPIYGSMINFAGAKPVPIALRESAGFSLDVDELASLITDKTKLIVLNTPANPTGGVIPRADLEAIAELAIKHDIMVMADEIYAELIYDGEHFSIGSLPGMAERTILLDGFSKTYAMTGWRLGYGIFPEDMAPAVTKLMVNSNSCTSVAVQRAGLEALTGPQNSVTEFRAAFLKRRELVVAGLNAIDGISCITPKGAFYAFPNITGTGLTSKQFADMLLDDYGVAAIAGTSFGEAGEGYFRLSYANSEANLEKALGRIAEATASVLAAR